MRGCDGIANPPAVAMLDLDLAEKDPVGSSQSIFPFLELPRELRDQIYNCVFDLQHERSERGLCIERRHLRYFRPTAPSILLVLHHDYFLLNRQIAREALEMLFKNHTVFLSCGPFVLKALLEKIAQHSRLCREWLKSIKSIQLAWVTFPNLRVYPPGREYSCSQLDWEYDEEEIDVDYVRDAEYNGHYDDNFYDPGNSSLYPSFHQHAAAQAPNSDDPFGFATHYPFTDPTHDPVQEASAEEVTTKLDLLVSMEVTPLFTYLASPTFNLTSITLPLYFISKEFHRNRNSARPGYTLPLKIRYWVQMCVHALLMLKTPRAIGATHTGSLQEVRIKYQPWDIWASMNPVDNLHRIVKKGVWFDKPEDLPGGEREHEGEAFRAVWAGMRTKLLAAEGVHHRHLSPPPVPELGLAAEIKYLPWDGNVDSCSVGDMLEVVFTRAIDP